MSKKDVERGEGNRVAPPCVRPRHAQCSRHIRAVDRSRCPSPQAGNPDGVSSSDREDREDG